MIKRLICLLWGHDLDKSDARTLVSIYDDGVKIEKLCYWCKRCHHYRKVD